MTVEDAVNELIAFSGTQFDPHVVAAFIEVLKRRGELTTNNFDQTRLNQALQSTPAAA
jgi:HD-GYP domain-containing protein (c-di-GMP phosphodiesterase class II)